MRVLPQLDHGVELLADVLSRLLGGNKSEDERTRTNQRRKSGEERGC